MIRAAHTLVAIQEIFDDSKFNLCTDNADRMIIADFAVDHLTQQMRLDDDYQPPWLTYDA